MCIVIHRYTKDLLITSRISFNSETEVLTCMQFTFIIGDKGCVLEDGYITLDIHGITHRVFMIL